MSKILINFIRLTLISCTLAQNPGHSYSQKSILPVTGARGMALGMHRSTLEAHDALLHNFSNISSSREPQFLIAGEVFYSTLGLHAVALAGHFPLGVTDNIGFRVYNYGWDAYDEFQIGLAYARSVSEQLKVSLRLEWLIMRIKEFGASAVPAFELALGGQMSESISYAIQFSNTDALSDEQFVQTNGFIRAGINCILDKNSRLYIELEQQNYGTPSLGVGIAYNQSTRVELRCGVVTNPMQFCLGMGLKAKSNIQIDIASRYGYDLGHCPSITLKYR